MTDETFAGTTVGEPIDRGAVDVLLERGEDALVADGTETYGYVRDGRLVGAGFEIASFTVESHPTGEDSDADDVERYLRTDVLPGLRSGSDMWDRVLEDVDWRDDGLALAYDDERSGFRFDVTLSF